MKKISPVLYLCLFVFLIVNSGASEIVANLRADYTAGSAGGDEADKESLGTGWAYLWNAPEDWDVQRDPASEEVFTGGIDSIAHYRPLVWNSERKGWGGSASEIPAPPPASFIGFRTTGDGRVSCSPGAPRDQFGNLNRYLILAYTVKEAGSYAIVDSRFESTFMSTDGHDFLIFTSADPENPIFETIFAPGTTDFFDTELGEIAAGTTIYIAIGPNRSHNSDLVQSLDFSIARVRAN